MKRGFFACVFAVATTVLGLTSCGNSLTLEPSAAGTKVAVGSDGFITFVVGATQNARTVAPVTPDVYWTVFGSTKSTDSEADWAKGVSDGDYSTVFFAKETEDLNRNSNIPFTIGAVDGRQW